VRQYPETSERDARRRIGGGIHRLLYRPVAEICGFLRDKPALDVP
jgi:hypothetical protein